MGAAASEHAADAAARLSERDRKILDFEHQWWKYDGSKEQAVKELFTMSMTRYYQILNELINDERAMAYSPLMMKRLQRMRARRQKTRSARRLGMEH